MNNILTLPSGCILQGEHNSYRIKETLGQGRFGITYLGITRMSIPGPLGSIETDVRIAIKEFFMHDFNGRDKMNVTASTQGHMYQDYKRKFKSEATNLSKLTRSTHHPHIPTIYECFEANNTVYYVLEYIDGGSLDEYINLHGSLSEEICIRMATEIGSALSFMHHNRMLHLDLKPRNIMLRSDGSTVLIDFGLSKQFNENGEPETSTNIGLGTPGYAPLEQANYSKDKQAGFPVTMDIYAFGATIFKMVTGHRPPNADEIFNNGFPIQELLNKKIQKGLINCIVKAMEPKKTNRFATVDDLLKELSSCAKPNSKHSTTENKEKIYTSKKQKETQDDIDFEETPKSQYNKGKVKEHESIIASNGPLPNGYIVKAETIQYIIQYCLGSDACSYTYVATRITNNTCIEVVLFEMFPNAFVGGRSSIWNDIYQMDYSSFDFDEMYNLFRFKINKMKQISDTKIVDKYVTAQGYSYFASATTKNPSVLYKKTRVKRGDNSIETPNSINSNNKKVLPSHENAWDKFSDYIKTLKNRRPNVLARISVSIFLIHIILLVAFKGIYERPSFPHFIYPFSTLCLGLIMTYSIVLASRRKIISCISSLFFVILGTGVTGSVEYLSYVSDETWVRRSVFNSGSSYNTYHLHKNLMVINSKGKEGLMNGLTGEIVAAPIYDNILNYSGYSIEINKGDVFFVKKDSKFGAINSEGNIVIPIEYDTINWEEIDRHEFGTISKNNKYGLVNKKGDIFIPVDNVKIVPMSMYDKIFLIYDNNGKKYWIDKNGKRLELTPEEKKRFIYL